MRSVALHPAERITVADPWRHGLAALILLQALLLCLYFETASSMVLIWSRSETFTHGFLVPPIVLWLVWRQRSSIQQQAPWPALETLIVLAGAALLWLIGELAVVNFLTQMSFVAMLVLAVPAVLGSAIARIIIFPLAFLFFSVPVGEFLLPQLMTWTADFTVLALRLSGIPVYRDGLNFVIPSGNWSVVEACSGVRYLISSLTVGTLYSYLNYRSYRRRLLFIGVSILVPVIANWMRAYMVVMLGHMSGNTIAVGVDHLLYGWVFFGIVIMLMFFIGARWAEPEIVKSLNQSVVPEHTVSRSIARIWMIVFGASVLVVLPHMAFWIFERDGAGLRSPLNAPAVLVNSWEAMGSVGNNFKPAYKNPSFELDQRYASEGKMVGLYLAYYHHQNRQRKLISSDNVLLASKDPQWTWVSSGSRPLVLEKDKLSVRTVTLRGVDRSGLGQDSSLLTWQFYWVGGNVTANEYLAKAYSALFRVLGRGDDSAVLVVYTPNNQADAADAALESFLKTNFTMINELLKRTQNGP